MAYDIFISYRHRYTADKAEHLLTLLENNGFRNRVSFDKDNLTQRFDLELIHRIDNCTDFIIVLSEDTFANIIESDSEKYLQLGVCPFEEFEDLQNRILPNPDFTRLELVRAIAQGKNIVPIAPIKNEQYNFEALSLPADIQSLNKWQAIFYDTNSSLTFQEIIEVKLLKGRKSLLKSTPSYKPDFSWKTFLGICLFMLLCLCGIFAWKDYLSYEKCKSIKDCNVYLETGLGLFNRYAQKRIKAIDELLEFSDCTDEIRCLVKGKDYSHLSQLQVEALNEILVNMKFVQGGKYQMGSTEEMANSLKEVPQHCVEVNDFFIGKFEVSRYEWYAIKGMNLANTSSDSLDTSISDVSWEDVVSWIEELNTMSGLNFSLPHEEEWEYAARGGVSCYDYVYAGSDNIAEVAWSSLDSLDAPHSRWRDGKKVDLRKENNALGLYDMSGNVAEMCCNDFYYYDGSKNFLGKDKVIRGGGYDSSIERCTVAYRDLFSRTMKNPAVGFRVILKNN